MKMRSERDKPSSFFNYIKKYGDRDVYISMKTWIILNRKIIRTLTKLHFLSSCKRFNIIPPHIYNACKLGNVRFSSPILTRKLSFSVRFFAQKIIKFEIRDAYYCLSSLRRELVKVTNYHSATLPTYCWNKFFNTQAFSLCKMKSREMEKIDKKLNWLLKKNSMNNHNSIPNISYFATSANDSDMTKISDFCFSFKEPIFKTSAINVIIDSASVKDKFCVDDIKKNWFLNLTNIDIPATVSDFLALGEKFSLPPLSMKKQFTCEVIKDVESNLRHLNQDLKSRVRLLTASSLERFNNNSSGLSNITKALIMKSNHTKEFIKTHPTVIFTKADKGNVTVALEKSDYIKKMELMLGDTDTYIKVNKKNPTKSIEKKLNECLKAWCNANYIDKKVYYSLICNDKPLPRAYGLPKIHKPNIPYRIIVSCVNTTLYKFASFLHNILHKNLPKHRSLVNNSFDLVGSLSGLRVGESDVLLSLDVVSLFTNIPLDLALDGVRRRWDFIKDHTQIPLEPFIRALEFVLSSTFFTFNGNTYQQTFGTPMGSPLSPIIADMVLQDLEESCLEKLNINIPIYYRYVDDILMVAPRKNLDLIVRTFNSYSPRLKFTLEIEKNRSINFLDTSITVVDDKLICNWYQKPTFSGRYLNFSSHHPIEQKKAVVLGIIDRAILLSHPIYHRENLIKAMRFLLTNDYPLDLVFKIFTKRLHYLFNNKLNVARGESDLVASEGDRREDSSDSVSPVRFITLPYYPKVTGSISRLLKNSNFEIAYKSFNTLRSYIKVHKDKLDHSSNSNIVYKLNCSSCDTSYVGQSSRQLRTRISEHQRDFYRAYDHQSVVSRHRSDSGHDFDWNNPGILDIEHFYHRRLISEMLHIKMQKNSINLMRDTELLDPAYIPLMNKLDF